MNGIVDHVCNINFISQLFDKNFPYTGLKTGFCPLVIWLCLCFPRPKTVFECLMFFSTPDISCLAMFF